MIFFRKLLQFLFPIRCVGCRIQNEHGLCSYCLKKIKPIHTKQHKEYLAIFSYKDPLIKKILWELKFNNNKEPVRFLVPYILDGLIDELGERHIFNNFQKPLLVPIPLHSKRLRERGFNQSEYITKLIHSKRPDIFEIETKSLVRIRYTNPQAKIQHRSEREKNVKDCFQALNPTRIHNRNIILIDDITTTGSTLKEATRALKKAGARRVYACVVAH